MCAQLFFPRNSRRNLRIFLVKERKNAFFLPKKKGGIFQIIEKKAQHASMSGGDAAGVENTARKPTPPRTTTVGTKDAQKQQKQNTKKTNNAGLPTAYRHNDMNDATSDAKTFSATEQQQMHMQQQQQQQYAQAAVVQQYAQAYYYQMAMAQSMAGGPQMQQRTPRASAGEEHMQQMMMMQQQQQQTTTTTTTTTTANGRIESATTGEGVCLTCPTRTRTCRWQ